MEADEAALSGELTNQQTGEKTVKISSLIFAKAKPISLSKPQIHNQDCSFARNRKGWGGEEECMCVCWGRGGGKRGVCVGVEGAGRDALKLQAANSNCTLRVRRKASHKLVPNR